MTEYLLFTLAAPIASYGAIAVGERRPTWDRPSKSQIIGLVAGALGIERSEEERQRALATSLGFAVRVDVPGQLATDYHTAQVPPQKRNRRFATRREELAVPKHELKTILSRREYRTGTHATVCLWLRDAGTTKLADIKNALEQPAFVPFAGRKAHALMLPMWPVIANVEGIEDAFAAYDGSVPEIGTELLGQMRRGTRGFEPVIFVDADAAAGLTVERLEQRRDMPESRAKWRFELRSEAVVRPRPPSGTGS